MKIIHKKIPAKILFENERNAMPACLVGQEVDHAREEEVKREGRLHPKAIRILMDIYYATEKEEDKESKEIR